MTKQDTCLFFAPYRSEKTRRPHEAKIPYRATASLVWSLIWPFTAALMIAMVIYQQRRTNYAIRGPRSGPAGMEG